MIVLVKESDVRLWSNSYITNIPGEARLTDATAESVFNRKMDETVPWHQQAAGCASV